MGRKKPKKSKNDARGYGSKPVSSKKTPVVSVKAHEGLQSLLTKAEAKKEDISTVGGHNLTAAETASKRFHKKISNLHDQLVECGFSENQVEAAVRGLASLTSWAPSNLFSLESALDWLCLNLPTEELPSLFVEEAVREKIHEVTTKVEVLESNYVQGESKEQRLERVFDPSTNRPVLSENKDPQSKTNATEDETDHKAWIVSQYQYEEDDNNDEAMTDAVAPKETSAEAGDKGGVSPEELALLSLEKQIEELRLTVNDDVANYMRSKQEIKELKKELSKLSGQAKKQRAKVAKIRAAREAETAAQDGNEAMDDVGDSDAGFFGMFEEAEEDEVQLPAQGQQQPPAEPEEEESASGLIRSSEPSIPKDWTGTTPKKMLEEHCRKRKIPRPSYQKLQRAGNGARLSIKTKPAQTVIEEVGPFYDVEDGYQFLATEALYKLNPELPLYRMFPPVFRDLWKTWLHGVKAESEAKSEEQRLEREKVIQKLINLIPLSSREVAAPDQAVALEEDVATEKVVDDWEERESDALGNDDSVGDSLSWVASRLKTDFEQRRQKPDYISMLKFREGLPISLYRQKLLDTMAENRVTVLCAETGAGKTTQCAQYLLEDALLSGQGDNVSIVCTQPRRISAMSVAERVADEMCDNVGGLVGYQIRMESRRSKATKLMFCTTGVLLRRLQDDPKLEGTTHVIVDEVHERQWQIDFLLIVLRQLSATHRPDLKILLMSATLDAKLFCSFFQGAPFLSVPGRTFPVAEYFLEDLLDATDHIIEEDSKYALRDSGPSQSSEQIWVTNRGGEKRRQHVVLESQTDVTEVSGAYQGYKMSTQRSMDRVDETVLNYDLIEDVLSLLATTENDVLVPPDNTSGLSGSILVFLPGMGEIRALSNRLYGSRVFGNQRRFDIIPIHSSLSPQDQKKAFRKPKPGCRKIILATNIAETSVTIPDVTCVIDSGLVREVRQDRRYATSKLVLDWCSKASTKQRAGRAGRVQPGICCKLFSSGTASRLRQQSVPELQRVPLEEVCLSILAGKLASNCMDFLLQAPEPPAGDAVHLALELLQEVGALDTTTDNREVLSVLGQHLSTIPLHVRLGKMLLFGVIFKCLDHTLTIVAGLSSKTPFVKAINNETEASARHKAFHHEDSDFLTLCNVWQAFVAERRVANDKGRRYCRQNFLSWTVLMEIGDVRKQLLDLLVQIGFVGKDMKESEVRSSKFNENGSKHRVLSAVVCAGLYPNVAHGVHESLLDPPQLWHRQERLYFHSSSVNHQKRKLASEWIVFHEKFATGRTSVAVTCPVSSFALVLFGGNVVVKHLERQVVVDDWIVLPLAAQTGVMLRDLRKNLNSVLEDRISQTVGGDGDHLIDGISDLLSK